MIEINRVIVGLALLASGFALSSSASAHFGILGGWAGKCAQSGGRAPGCGQIPEVSNGLSGQERQNLQQQYRAQQAELDRLEAERREQEARAVSAAAADAAGLNSENAGDWKGAADKFIEALGYAPDDATIRAHLDQANARLADMRADAQATEDVGALRQRIRDQIAAADIAAIRQQTENTILSQRLTALYEGIRNGSTRRYVPSGNGLVGGMTWMLGYNVRTMNPKLVARAREMLQKEMDLAGIPYNASIDFQKYDFVLGIAASADLLQDLGSRVVFDQLSSGRFSAVHQDAYKLLIGRSFDELGCHSNGAMVCLAALENQDVVAKRVVLYGPQITAESLSMWNNLVTTGRIRSIELFLNEGDPVPALSFVFSNPATAAFAPLLSRPLLEPSVMRLAIHTFAPSIYIKVSACGKGADVSCHDMHVYKISRGNCPASSGKTVRGTAFFGKPEAAEPPPPC